MKQIAFLVLGVVLMTTSACGLFKAEVGLPPTEASGGAIRILGIPLLESVNWCAGEPCRLGSRAPQTVNHYQSSTYKYVAPPVHSWGPPPPPFRAACVNQWGAPVRCPW
jgi:hypothetical protein